MQIWRIEDFNKVDVPEEQYGSFYCCDSYVLLYNYRAEESGKESHIVYFWQGIESSRVRCRRRVPRWQTNRAQLIVCRCVCFAD
mgnify:CR=1 FL=1